MNQQTASRDSGSAPKSPTSAKSSQPSSPKSIPTPNEQENVSQDNDQGVLGNVLDDQINQIVDNVDIQEK